MTIKLFAISLFSTLFVTRIFTGRLHDRGGENLLDDSSKTLTGIIRRKTKRDFHHFHLGLIALMLVLLLLFIKGANNFIVLSLGVSISLIADDLTLFIRKELSYPSPRYFDKKIFFESIFLHVAILVVAILIF